MSSIIYHIVFIQDVRFKKGSIKQRKSAPLYNVTRNPYGRQNSYIRA